MALNIPKIAKKYLKHILQMNGLHNSHFTKKRTPCRQKRFAESIQAAIDKKQITEQDVEVILYLWG